MKKIDESETQTVYEQDGGRMTVSKIGHGSMCFCNKCISSEQPERSKREDSETYKVRNGLYKQSCMEKGAVWHGLEELVKSEEMRCSEHGGNVVREVQ